MHTKAPTLISIAFVLPSFAGGGAQKVMITLASRLDRTRFSPFFVVFEASGAWRSLVPADMPVISVERSSLRAALPKLIRTLRRERPHVIVSTLAYVNAGLLLTKPFLPSRTRFIVREANTPRHHAQSNVGRLAYYLAYRLLYPWADKIICPASSLAEELAATYGLDRKRIAVINNPVDEKTIRAEAEEPKRRSGTGRRFVAVGRLTEQKGFDRLLQDFAQLPGDSHLVIFGEGELHAKLQQQIEGLGLAGRAVLAGFEPQPGAWIAGADALLLPSRWEGLPNVALEALACGAPVIATPESGGITEIAAQAATGAVTLAQSGAAFVTAMLAIAPRLDRNLYPSLLPSCYKLEEASTKFASILAE